MKAAAILSMALGAAAQQPGTQKPAEYPPISLSECTSAGCTKQSKSVVLDSNWMWVHTPNGYQNCYEGNSWSCGSPTECAQCELDSGSIDDYASTYGVTANTGDDLRIQFVTENPQTGGRNVGARTYMMDSATGGEKYRMFYLLNKEFTFTVNVANIGCGLNGALYFVEMEEDGGKGRYPGNNAGAAYGTGYCDAQCPHDIKFINGEGNSIGWDPSDEDINSGKGYYGTCCAEMDIWEANSISNAYTPHVCTEPSQYRCEGIECGDNDADERYDGICDKDGCDIQPYRMGDTSFYGPGSNFTVDSSRPFTVVTQFLTDDGTDNGELSEIRRLYVQDGVVIPSPTFTMGGLTFDSITDSMCNTTKEVFNDVNGFADRGGMKAMSDSLKRGHVLVMSLWDDYAVEMQWLDSIYPVGGDPTPGNGDARGTCPNGAGKPSLIEETAKDSYVQFSNIKVGTIGSTYEEGGGPDVPIPDTPGQGGQCAYGAITSPLNCAGSYVCCDNGGNPGEYASCQESSYCLSSQCAIDGLRTVPCTIVDSDPVPPSPVTSPTAPPPAGDCPGGDLAACIGVCPGTPIEAYQICVNTCVERCT